MAYMTLKNLGKPCDNVQGSGNTCSNCSQDKKHCCDFPETIINQVLELQSAYFKWVNTMNTVIKNTHEVGVVAFAQAINKELKTVLANMLKETPSVDDKPDTLNDEVVKALQEISAILKEIQEIQEVNFIAVSNIKNALNNMPQLINSGLCAALAACSALPANNSLPSHALKCSFDGASNSEAKRTCLSFLLPQTVPETLTLIRSLQFSPFSTKQQSMASKGVSSSHDVTLTQTIISAKSSMPAVKNPDANKKNAEKNNANNKNANKNDADKDANNKDVNKKGAENKNAKKADANVTFNVSSEGFQNWFFGQGDL
ncbi:uncharacterized protein CIMG_13537 [Coccidioides immitis RS]|uniref:Uncharacterized protein n=1 Tax=Coccidioides immitis (strain RS) TaxID=246410 RepID=J3K0R1_COCIM|nr:uncharacterized protein CIMG_13537 [Coccidioides immitis RS]EAS27455.3 hypothetical protein CIMG_13537 [Coccidioides immitis RS]